MTASEAKLPKRGAVRSQLVGHNHVRRKRVPLQQLAKKLHGRGLVASPLNKHIQHLTLAIDGTPQIHALAIDRYDHFIEVPLTIRFGPRVSQISRDRRTKLQDPAADGLVADAQASRSEKVLNVAVAQGEPQIQPNRVADKVRREAVMDVRNGAHHHSYPILPVTVTMPSAANRKGVAFRSNHTVSVQLHTIPRLGYDLEHEHVFGSGKLLKDLMYCLPGFLSESAPVRHDWVCAKHQPDEQTIGHVLMFEVEPLLLTAAARR